MRLGSLRTKSQPPGQAQVLLLLIRLQCVLNELGASCEGGYRIPPLRFHGEILSRCAVAIYIAFAIAITVVVAARLV